MFSTLHKVPATGGSILCPSASEPLLLLRRPVSTIHRSRLVTVAVARPSGRGDKSNPTPAAKASPTQKLPPVTRASTAPINSKQASPTLTPTTEARVGRTAEDAKQGVNNVARAAKQGIAAVEGNTQNTRVAVSRQADSLKDGVDAGADAVKDALSGATNGAENLANDFERRASAAANRVEAGVAEASDTLQEGFKNVSQRLEQVIDQAPEEVAGAVQQAVDTTAAGIRGAQQQLRELQKPGPSAPFQFIPLTSLSDNPFVGRPGPTPAEDKQAEYYKKRLLFCVSGLDRGFAANTTAVAEVEATVASLLSVAPPVLLSWAPGSGSETSTLAQLNATWRLVFSSAFAKGNAPSLPGSKLGQVYQAISAYASRLDNVVEFYSTVNLPQLPGFPKVEPITTTLSLKHYFEAIGGSTVQITFEDTEIKTSGGLNGILGRLPEVLLPQLPEGLRPSKSSRSSTFEVLFLDDELRITRGSRGELRIFIRT